MIETDGYALEVVAPDPDSDPPQAGYSYTINFPDHVGFPDVVVFGLTPVAARGLLGLVPTRSPPGPRSRSASRSSACWTTSCAAASPPSISSSGAPLFATAQAWYRGDEFEIVQLVYPDRNGFLPYEAGFDQRLRFAQPVIGTASVELISQLTPAPARGRPVVPLPLDALLVEQFEERVGAERLGPEHAGAAPGAGGEHLDRHRRHHRRLPDDGLMTELAHRPGVVDDVVQVDRAVLAVGARRRAPTSRRTSCRACPCRAPPGRAARRRRRRAATPRYP